MFTPEEIKKYQKMFYKYNKTAFENAAMVAWRNQIDERVRQKKAVEKLKGILLELQEQDEPVPDVEKFRADVGNMFALFEHEYLKNAFCRLKKKHKEIIFLSFFLNLSTKEIAEILHTKKEVIYVYKSNALKSLKKLVLEELNEEKRLRK